MKNNNNNLYFWLDEEGEAIEVTEKEFEHLQRIWNGERPTDYNAEGFRACN